MRRTRHWSIRASAVIHMPSGLGDTVNSEANFRHRDGESTTPAMGSKGPPLASPDPLLSIIL